MQHILAGLMTTIVVGLVAVYSVLRNYTPNVDRQEVVTALQQRDMVLLGLGKKTELLEAEIKHLNSLLTGNDKNRSEKK